MFSSQPRKIPWMLLSVVLLASACSRPVPPPSIAPSEAIEVGSGDVSPAPFPTVTLTSTLEPQPTAVIISSSTPFPSAKVTITAVKGNLFIRRGPGMAYNPIGVLNKGDTLSVLARDVLSNWVQVPLSQSGETGWISVRTKYSSLSGDISKLSGIQVDYWPVAGYVINCSYHEMVLQPGDIIIPSLLSYPENEVWVYPGKYTAYDTFVPGSPEVKTIEMREGLEVKILVNGLGEKHKCP